MTMPEAMTNDAYVAELGDAIEKIWAIARRMNLDPFPVNFELVPATIMYEFGSYGLPGRFSHWSRGKAYYRMKTDYDYGLSKIYELVVNTNPSYAFLMEQNDLLQNKVVVAHVLGHTDMFKNNIYFKRTPPNMIDKVSVNADRIRSYEYAHGTHEVERFLDAVLAIEEHIDPNFRIRRLNAEEAEERRQAGNQPRASDYDDLWDINQKAADRKRDQNDSRFRARARRFPAEPEKDLLLFLAEHAPSLEPWQRDILLIVREEMQYFVPQMQTKTLNEGWACLVPASLVLTEQGLMRYDALHDQLERGETLGVASGSGKLDQITGRHMRRTAPTIRLRTRRGLVLEGAEEHKLSIDPDQWIALKDLHVGQRIPLSVGDNIWAKDYMPVALPARPYISGIRAVARTAGVNGRHVYRWLNGERTNEASSIAVAVKSTGYDVDYHQTRAILGHKLAITAPPYIDEAFGEFLGFLIGDGNIHLTKAAIGFTSGDRESADRFAALVKELFALEPKVFWDDRTINGKGGRWRVVLYATAILEVLHAIGIDLGAKASEKRIPDVILRSPKSVVSAFLRAYFDCDGCASITHGVILSTFSEEIQRTLQVLLLNYGILSRKNKNRANIHIAGASAELYEREIGFGLARKREKLRAYIEGHKWFLAEDPTDQVVSIEHGLADVYDITVDERHQYVAGGMLHHNSYWHAHIMRELDLTDAEYAAFAQMHAGVLAPNRMHINPYHVGYHILEDIERRWDNPTEEEREKLGRVPGQGKAKIFEVREIENDVSLLRNYLTKQLVEELDLYLYRKEGDQWVIVEKNWEKVRDGIIGSMTNFGYPYLTVDDADYNRNTELLLRHHVEGGRELDIPYAEKTLEYLYQIWSRPVHLETIADEEPIRLTYDGEQHSQEELEEGE
jgi:stage V sporulation protein R